MTSHYQTVIRAILARIGGIGTDPRHIEAWMRVEHATLDHLSTRQFEDEVKIALALVNHDGPSTSERLAQSMGL